MKISDDIFGFNKRFDEITRKLDKSRQMHNASYWLGWLLMATLLFIIVRVALPQKERGLTHYDRVQTLRLMDDINR